jgi:hypothetical protein
MRGKNLRAQGKYHRTSGSSAMRSRNEAESIMIGLPKSSERITVFPGKNEDKKSEPRFGPHEWVIMVTLDCFERYSPIEWTHCSTPPKSGQ